MKNLSEAIRLLEAACGVLAQSSVYRTAAQGSAKGAADYYNMAVKIATSREPSDFKSNVLRAIEHRLGRRRDMITDRSVVPIDMDIAIWGDQPITYGDKPWRSPSADIAGYAYAAVPLAEIGPDLVHPELGVTLAQIAARFPPGDVTNVGSLPR